MARQKAPDGSAIINTRDAINARAAAAARREAVGAQVKVRAIQRGYYGRPTPDLIDAGTEFLMPLKDLEAGGSHAGRDQISHEGKTYDLPSWVESAARPARDLDEDDAPPPRISGYDRLDDTTDTNADLSDVI